MLKGSCQSIKEIHSEHTPQQILVRRAQPRVCHDPDRITNVFLVEQCVQLHSSWLVSLRPPARSVLI